MHRLAPTELLPKAVPFVWPGKSVEFETADPGEVVTVLVDDIRSIALVDTPLLPLSVLDPPRETPTFSVASNSLTDPARTLPAGIFERCNNVRKRTTSQRASQRVRLWKASSRDRRLKVSNPKYRCQQPDRIEPAGQQDDLHAERHIKCFKER